MRIGLGLDLSCPLLGNGQAPFTPASISNLELWLDATDAGTISLRDSTYVTDWADKSVKGNHFSQTVAAEQPAIGTNEVDFAASLAHMIAGSNYIFSDNDGMSLVASARDPVGGTVTSVIFNFGLFFSEDYGLSYTRSRSNGWADSQVAQSAPGTDAGFHRSSAIITFDDKIRLYTDNVFKADVLATSISFLNATNIAESPTQVDNVSGPMTIGKASSTDQTTREFLGALKTLCIYSKVLSASEQLNLDTYLAALP